MAAVPKVDLGTPTDVVPQGRKSVSESVLLLGDGPEADKAAEGLRTHAYRVSRSSIERGLDHYHALRPVVVVLDLSGATRAGLELCRALRASSDVPLLVLGPDLDEVDELLAFAHGADAVLAAPMQPRRIAARVEALVRRHHWLPSSSATPDTLGYGPILVALDSRTVSIEGRPVDLTRTEFELLTSLLENPQRVVTRDQLVRQVWPGWQGDDHVLDVQISRLRRKIQRAGGPRIGAPVRGVGYRLTHSLSA